MDGLKTDGRQKMPPVRGSKQRVVRSPQPGVGRDRRSGRGPGAGRTQFRQFFAAGSGAAIMAFLESLMRPLSSMLMTLTVTESPILTTSSTFFT